MILSRFQQYFLEHDAFIFPSKIFVVNLLKRKKNGYMCYMIHQSFIFCKCWKKTARNIWQLPFINILKHFFFHICVCGWEGDCMFTSLPPVPLHVGLHRRDAAKDCLQDLQSPLQHTCHSAPSLECSYQLY